MLAFLRKNQIPVSACFCVLLSLYILTVSARGQLTNEPVGVVLMWLMRPLQIAAQATSGWLIGIQENYLTMSGFKSENERLRKRIQSLEVERQKYLEAQATHRKLAGVVGLSHAAAGESAHRIDHRRQRQQLVSRLRAR